MIPIVLRDLRWRIAAMGLLSIAIYFLEPAFHQHGPVDPAAAGDLTPTGISASLAYFSALSMVRLLAGFSSRDVREGFAALHFSHPTSPVALDGLRWAAAVGVALVGALTFLLVGQFAAWGEVRGGGEGMLLALLAALVYGGLMAFLSALLPSGDGWVGFILFLPTPVPQLLTWVESALPATLYQIIAFLLPPQGALQEVYRGLLLGMMAWPAVAFAAGYGVFWLAAAALLLRLRRRF